jgi:hypothetical protein
MVYNIGLQIAYPNSQKQQSVAAQLVTYIAQFESDLYPARTAASCVRIYNAAYKWGANWQFTISAECQLRTLANRDQMWADLDASLGSGQQGPVTNDPRPGHGWRFDIQNDEDPPDYTKQNLIERFW